MLSFNTVGFETVGQDLNATSGDHTDQKHVFYRKEKKKYKSTILHY